MPSPETFDTLFPADRRPPDVQNYGGPKLADAVEPHYQVDLDAGSFRVLWELLESEARHRYATHNSMSTARALLRALESFRSTYWAVNTPPRRKMSEAVTPARAPR